MNESSQENIIIYDWLSFTTKIHTVEQIKKIIGFAKLTFLEIYGYYGYSKRITYEGVSILYDGHSPNMGVLVEMSGQGCRAYETLGTGDWEPLFKLIICGKSENNMNITRLDIAYDDHEGLFDIQKLYNDTEAGNYISRTRNYEVRKGNKGQTISHGSKKSSVYIRIYDKAKERGHTDNRHWIRLEIQLRDENALSFIKNDIEIGSKFRGVVYSYLRYVTPNQADTNKRRWSDADYWQEFVQSSEKISIYEKPGIDYNELSLEDFVLRNAGNCINVFIKIYGIKNFLRALNVKDKYANYSQKLIRLIEKYKDMPNQTPATFAQFKGEI